MVRFKYKVWNMGTWELWEGRGTQGQYVYWIVMPQPRPETIAQSRVKEVKDFDRDSFRALVVQCHADCQIEIVETASFLEPHGNGEFHHNAASTQLRRSLSAASTQLRRGPGVVSTRLPYGLARLSRFLARFGRGFVPQAIVLTAITRV